MDVRFCQQGGIMNKVIFMNVDTQKDFCEKDGSLYVNGVEDIKPNLKTLTEFSAKNNIIDGEVGLKQTPQS